MPRAIWNNTVIAEATPENVEIVEGNTYFPADAIRKEYFKPSETITFCGWKGIASYYHVEVDGQKNTDAAWFYPAPKDAAKQITGHVAFWNGVTVEA